MKEGANPEMDGLKKLVAGRLRTHVVEPHPDPDVLAAFAENALPEAERAPVLQHLGACNDCREILYLAAGHSPEAQPVLSFQPKRRPGRVFRWGALAASVVIVAGAVIAKYPLHREAHEFQPAASSAVETYSKIAKDSPPTDENMRDQHASTAQRLAQPPNALAKERPEQKHMTARPQASMQFDDTDQVRVASSPSADSSKKFDEALPLVGRNVTSPLPAPAREKPGTQPSADWQAAGQAAGKDKRETDFASAGYLAQKQGFQYSVAGTIGGTIVDPSGAAVGDAKVTASGPVGSRTVTSDDEGRFVLNSLAPGSYSVEAEASGFKSTGITNVAVLDNKPATVAVRLEPASATESVEVSAASVPVNDEARADSALSSAATNGIVASKATGATLQKAIANNAPPQMKTVPVAQWMLSAQGAVQESLDLGRTWQKVQVASNAAFRSLCSIGQHVWVGGSAGVLYHSVDSGASWKQVQPSAADQKLTSDISHIEFSDPADGTVSTTNGEVWSTSDGGQTWRRIAR